MRFASFVILAILLHPYAGASELIITGAPMKLHKAPSLAAQVEITLSEDARVAPRRVEGQFVEVSLPGTEITGWLHLPDADVTPGRLPGPKADAAWTTLAQLGLPAGWTFEDLEAGHQHRFRFPLPRFTEIEGATFRLGFNRVASQTPYSVLRVEVNGQPVRSHVLSSDGMRWIDVPVAADLLTRDRGDFVDLTLTASSLTPGDSCRTDERSVSSFLHISPSSGLSLTLGKSADTLAAAWEGLPPEVTVSLSPQPDEAAFVSALAIVRQLVGEHRKVRIVRLPRLGDIVIAPRTELDTAIADRPGGVEALAKANHENNVSLVELPEQRIIALSPLPGEWPAGLAMFGWMNLANDSTLNVRTAQSASARPLPASLEEASFELLGADTNPLDVFRSAEWKVPLGVDRIPAGRVPAHMRLAVTSEPDPEERPMMLYAYVGNVLQDVHRMKGGAENFTLHFARSARRGIGDDLRLVVRRDHQTNECLVPITGSTVQISSGSSIVFEPWNGTPHDFGDLPRSFSTGADLIIEPGLLERAETTLPFIANLLNANRYPLFHERVRIAQPMAEPDGPFILVATQSNGITKQAVHFDRGQIAIRKPDGEIILDTSAPAGITVAQMVEHGSHHGLWITPPASGSLPDAPPRMLQLTFDTVAFLDDKGLALSLNPDQSDFARLNYPEYRDWFDVFGAYRYWLMGLGWLLLVGLLAHLYVKVRSHKRTR